MGEPIIVRKYVIMYKFCEKIISIFPSYSLTLNWLNNLDLSKTISWILRIFGWVCPYPDLRLRFVHGREKIYYWPWFFIYNIHIERKSNHHHHFVWKWAAEHTQPCAAGRNFNSIRGSLSCWATELNSSDCGVSRYTLISFSFGNKFWWKTWLF